MYFRKFSPNTETRNTLYKHFSLHWEQIRNASNDSEHFWAKSNFITYQKILTPITSSPPNNQPVNDFYNKYILTESKALSLNEDLVDRYLKSFLSMKATANLHPTEIAALVTAFRGIHWASGSLLQEADRLKERAALAFDESGHCKQRILLHSSGLSTGSAQHMKQCSHNGIGYLWSIFRRNLSKYTLQSECIFSLYKNKQHLKP